MKMALASLSGAFEGTVRITDQVPPLSFRLIVEGTGKIGFMKRATGSSSCPRMRLEREIAYEGDVQVGGTMARSAKD